MKTTNLLIASVLRSRIEELKVQLHGKHRSGNALAVINATEPDDIAELERQIKIFES